MKLLIVDDQLATLKGLNQGIDWEKIGITRVHTAQNAMQARLLFRSEVPDLILCDIEMPVESGIALCQWVRDQGYPTRVIFLTCHSEFEYAKDAISLGAVGYIVQPASYAVICEAVSKAVVGILESRKERSAIEKVDLVMEQWEHIRRGIWRSYLTGAVSSKALNALEDIPKAASYGYLVLLQIVRWQTSAAAWQDGLVTTALGSFLTDVFSGESYRVVMAYMEKHTYAIAFEPLGENRDVNQLIQRLQYLCDIYEMYMPCAVACHLSEYMSVGKMPAAWNELLARRAANVSSEAGVLYPSGRQALSLTAPPPELGHWKDMLALQQGAQMEQQAVQLLDDMVADRSLNAESLLGFYQDFMKILYSTDQSNQQTVNNLFQTPESIELYRNGMKSVDEMKALIHYVAETYSVQLSPRGQAELVQSIAAYINDHLDSDIRKSDLVDRFHLNGDYLTRLFKKHMGSSVKSYIIEQKLLNAQRLLRTTTLPVSYIAARFGYSNFSHFSTAYRKQFGITPQEEQKAHRKED